MAFLAELGGFLSDGTVIGLVDASIPTGGYSGWAGYGVSWSKPTPAPRPTRSPTHGLDHVNCLGDTDGDGISQEAEGGRSTGATRPGCRQCARWRRSAPTATSASPTTGRR